MKETLILVSAIGATAVGVFAFTYGVAVLVLALAG